MKNIETETKCGKIRGIDNDDFIEYRGIRYATAKRWKYPEIITKWDGVYDATEFGECSYQHRGFEDDATVNAFYHNEFRKGMSFTYSEDCLFLNIYSPKNPDNCPVLIYIHGGSFTGGSANEGHISGTEFAKNGIIFVSLNYRLGPYGFCSHPDLRNEDGICGNFGLYDQYTAIKWVKDNIEQFGGNPEKITLLGQSAGAMSVDIHLSSPLCKGWFTGAVLMSGAALQRGAARPLAPEKTEKFWNDIIANANVNNIEELSKVDAKTLYFAWNEACKNDKMSMLHTLPVCDGRLITKESFNMNTIPKMPKMIGITITDMVPSVLKYLTEKWVKKDKDSDCYIYCFSRELPGDDKGAWHASDLLYAFSTLGNNWRPFEDIDYTISNQFSKSICAFVKNANPNCKEIPVWKAGTEKIMHFCEETKPAPWMNKKLRYNTLHNGGSI